MLKIYIAQNWSKMLFPKKARKGANPALIHKWLCRLFKYFLPDFFRCLLRIEAIRWVFAHYLFHSVPELRLHCIFRRA